MEDERTPVLSEAEQKEVLLRINADVLRTLVDHPDQSEAHLGGSRTVAVGEAQLAMPVVELRATVNAEGQLMRSVELDKMAPRDQGAYARINFLKPLNIPGREVVAINERFVVGVKYSEDTKDEAKALVRESLVQHNIEGARTPDDLADALEIIKGFEGTTGDHIKVIDNALFVIRELQKPDLPADHREYLLSTVTNKSKLRDKMIAVTASPEPSPELADIGAAHVELPEPPRSGGKGPGWFQRALSGLSRRKKD